MTCLDFSEFHPLDHWIGAPDCWRWYGGPGRHLSLWWDYQRPGWDRGIDWEHPLTEDEIRASVREVVASGVLDNMDDPPQ